MYYNDEQIFKDFSYTYMPASNLMKFYDFYLCKITISKKANPRGRITMRYYLSSVLNLGNMKDAVQTFFTN